MKWMLNLELDEGKRYETQRFIYEARITGLRELVLGN